MLHQRPADLTATKARAVIPRDALKRAATLLQAVIERRNTIPILSYIKVRISPEGITLTGTDMDNALSVMLEAETEGEATVMLASAVISGFAPIAAGPVTLTLSGRDAQAMDVIQLSDGETAITVNDHMPPEDFPEVRPRKFIAALRPAVTLTQDQTARLIRLCRHCISTEETRYYLNGIWMTTKPGAKTLRAVATNGHRMAVIDHDAEADFSASGDTGLIVQTKTIEMLRLIIGKGGNEPVQFDCGKNFLSVAVGGITIHAKTIDGTFPDYTRVIPPPSGNLVAHLSGSALQRMWHAARAMREGSTGAELNFTEGRIGFRSPSFNEATFSMPLQARRAEGCTIDALGFNLGYLRDQGAITPTFTISTASADSPATIHSDDPDALWILMPMRL